METNLGGGSNLGNNGSRLEVAFDRMETQQTSTVETNVCNEREVVHEVDLAEAKQEAGDKPRKKASRKSQQALEGKAQCMDEEIPRCNVSEIGIRN